MRSEQVGACLLAWFLVACAVVEDHVVLRASIRKNSEWVIEQRCGYQCAPLVDFLISKHIAIRLEPPSLTKPSRFSVLVELLLDRRDRYLLDTRMLGVRISDGADMKPKAESCDGPASPNYKKGFEGVVPLDDEHNANCFVLVIDAAPPSIDQTFTLRINGLARMGMPIDVPEITFAKGISRW